MNFEKIEISGFKSFADKVEITFDNGVTGIVGPNGCGKSNISDAIRWVLGEQSAKSLRGSAMTDVIFSGTQNRKSLSFCEVSLYFDNSQGLFQSTEYSEVILTRKLFRDGSSEYSINKQPARMKDIINLLHECGVSKSGYSIIGQGKVAEILSSKPEDRRVIFEEAVGITKTKNEKIETERKLERTRENITRIFDVTSEMERRLEPCERAAEKARKSFDLFEQLKYHEINNYLYKYDNASVVKGRIQARIDGLTEECAQREKESRQAQADYTRSMEDVGKFDRLISELSEKILEESVKQERNEGNSKLINEKISFCKSEIEKLKEDIAEKEEMLELKRKAADSKRDYMLECDERIKVLNDRINKLNLELSSILVEISKGENLAQSAQSKMLGAVESLADINRNIGSLDTEKTVISAHQQEVLDKLKELSDRYNALINERESIKAQINLADREQKDLEKDILDIEQLISAANNDISELSNKIYNTGIRISSLESNLKIYQNIKESYEGYSYSVKKIMLAAKDNKAISDKVKGVVASIISTDNKFSVAIETALGGTVQNIVTERAEDAQYLIEYLKASNGGRATFLPISAVKTREESYDIINAAKERGALGLATKLVRFEPYYERVVQHLLNNTLIVDTTENAVIIAKKYRFGFKIVTLDGDVLSASGSMSGGSRKQQSQSGFLSTDEAIKKLSDELARLRPEQTKLSAEKERLSKRANDLIDKLDAKNVSLRQSGQQLVALRAKLNGIEELVARSEEEIKSSNDAVLTIKTRLGDISQAYQSVEEGNRKLREEREYASNDAIKHQTEYDKLKKRREELTDENTSLRSELSSLYAESKAASEVCERTEAEIKETLAIIAKNNATIEADIEIVKKLYEQIESITAQYEESSGIKILRDQLNEAKQKKASLSDIIAQLDLKRQMLSSEITKLGEKKHAEEIAASKVDTELEYLQQRVEEEYKLNYDTCKDLRDENYNIGASQQAITDLKRKISALGPVNPSAIEEYNELKTRYDDFMTQRTDLEKAEDDLKKAIAALTTEMLATFNTGFEQIRTHFQRIFKELFGGGSADLVLDKTQVDDPLEAGIEIIAEPPGKKLQKISLLSGGEMSLTAIAILFAILKLRPMPFCVLDEIEAALDDANVERFARYLKNFSSETQFIVITHKKVTMELSDALFGVTMPEKGVSKIVSVKLSEIKDTIDID